MNTKFKSVLAAMVFLAGSSMVSSASANEIRVVHNQILSYREISKGCDLKANDFEISESTEYKSIPEYNFFYSVRTRHTIQENNFVIVQQELVGNDVLKTKDFIKSDSEFNSFYDDDDGGNRYSTFEKRTILASFDEFKANKGKTKILTQCKKRELPEKKYRRTVEIMEVDRRSFIVPLSKKDCAEYDFFIPDGTILKKDHGAGPTRFGFSLKKEMSSDNKNIIVSLIYKSGDYVEHIGFPYKVGMGCKQEY